VQRSGRLTQRYNPDEATPLPRPFILDGEGKGVKPVALKPHAPPKIPDSLKNFGYDTEISKKDLYSIKWFAEFKKIEQGGSVTRAPEVRKLSAGLAELLGLKGGKGVYIRWRTGWKYNVLTGKMDIPVYDYKKVHSGILDQWKNGSPQWGNDPRKAMALARFFYKYGFRSDYYALKKWMVQRAKAIRDDQKRAYYDWYAKSYSAWQQQRDDWFRWRDQNY